MKYSKGNLHIPYISQKESKYVKVYRQMLKSFIMFFIAGNIIIFINSIGITGIPLEEGMTEAEIYRHIDRIKQEREKIIREVIEEREKEREREKKEEELAKQEQQIPIPGREELPVHEEQVIKEEEEEKLITDKVSPPLTTKPKEGIIPGVITPEQKREEAKEIKEEVKTEDEYKFQRNFSLILMIIAMIATIVLLIRSMSSRGKAKDEKEKK